MAGASTYRQKQKRWHIISFKGKSPGNEVAFKNYEKNSLRLTPDIEIKKGSSYQECELLGDGILSATTCHKYSHHEELTPFV